MKGFSVPAYSKDSKKKMWGALFAVTAILIAAISCSPADTGSNNADSTACTNTQTDPLNCGACGNACQPGQQCNGGVCQCTVGLLACPSGCANAVEDPNNCGSCGIQCSGGQVCSLGKCSSSCDAGLTMCGAACVNTTTSDAYCGDCNTACGPGQTCSNGACVGGGTGGAGNTGGSGTGGTAQGGTTSGGSGGTVNTGGTNTQGGAGMGGGNTGGSGGTVNPGDAPPGYWTYGDWHGCSWTGVDAKGLGTMVTPQDFTTKPAEDAYCVSGSVGADMDYETVALLGFNVNEPTTADCSYKPVDVNADGPPSVMPMADGIAVNFVKQGADTSFTLRVQIQGPNGHKEGDVGAADRWCYTITETQGKVFAPYSEFTPECWETVEADKGTPYAGQPISAVVFLVPGDPTATPFDFCVNGFAYGSSADDAPDGPVEIGDQTGTVGGEGNRDLDFDRTKITVDGEQYIIQNNNWYNPESTDCILSYVNNSFTVDTCTGSGQSAPNAFPSIYIGNNGNTANGVFSTMSTDSMPIQISNINRIDTSLRWSGNNGSYNTTYDVWFANAPPAGSYNDGIDGFVMVWLAKPSGGQVPIGSDVDDANIAGHDWDVWVGPRGQGPDLGSADITPDPQAPVVSYVIKGNNINELTNFNLKDFITNAVGRSGNGSKTFTESLYLTDVFAGFEIWNGGAGLKVDEFTCNVVPN